MKPIPKPRAKIGDVVVAIRYWGNDGQVDKPNQFKIINAEIDVWDEGVVMWCYQASLNRPYLSEDCDMVFDEDILYNLSTGESYIVDHE